MTPAIPASRPDTIPSSKDFLNICLRLFGHGHGYVQFDLFTYVATGLDGYGNSTGDITASTVFATASATAKYWCGLAIRFTGPPSPRANAT